jgi:hypothetical protein
MSQLPKPPDAYVEFTHRFPKIGKAWEMLGEGGRTSAAWPGSRTSRPTV